MGISNSKMWTEKMISPIRNYKILKCGKQEADKQLLATICNNKRDLHQYKMQQKLEKNNENLILPLWRLRGHWTRSGRWWAQSGRASWDHFHWLFEGSKSVPIKKIDHHSARVSAFICGHTGAATTGHAIGKPNEKQPDCVRRLTRALYMYKVSVESCFRERRAASGEPNKRLNRPSSEFCCGAEWCGAGECVCERICARVPLPAAQCARTLSRI